MRGCCCTRGAGKSLAELEELEAGISGALEDDSVDPEYYSAVLRRLRVEKGRAVLREIHSGLLQRSLDAMMVAQDPANIAEAMGWDRDAAQGVCVGSAWQHGSFQQQQSGLDRC